MQARSRFAAALFVLSFSTLTFASVIPQLPDKMPPRTEPAPYPPAVEQTKEARRRPVTRRDVEASSLTPIAQAMQITAIENAAHPASRPVAAQPDTAGWGLIRLCNDTNEDVEPAIIRSKRSNYQGVGVDTTLAAYMKRFANGKYQLNALFTDGDTYVPNPGPLPLPAGYTTSADPIVSANPYTTGTNPRAYYVAGTAQAYTEGGGPLANGIFVWSLHDGEIVWQRSTIATNTDTFYFLDKPSMVVDWSPQNLGWVWVTYVKVPVFFGGTNTIYLYRSIDGVNYSQAPATISGFNIHSPTVVVDSSTGYVYLLWISYSDNKIYVAYTTNGGVSFSTPIGFDAGSANEPLLGPGNDSICDNLGGPCINARTILSARYNSVNHSIGVVWQRREPVNGAPAPYSNVKTDIFFNSYSTTSQEWRGTRKVNHSSSVNDQWNGALDFDDIGYYIVAWYDRRNDPNNRKYEIYATRLTAMGERVEYYGDVLIYGGGSLNQSDPTVYEPYQGRILMGEYHDVWSWYDPVNFRWVFHSAGVHIAWPSTQGDIWDDQIQQ